MLECKGLLHYTIKVAKQKISTLTPSVLVDWGIEEEAAPSVFAPFCACVTELGMVLLA